MRWKLWLSIILLACCQATFISARPQPGRRGLSLIVVPTEVSAAELRSRIQSGASFEAIALAYSTDPTATAPVTWEWWTSAASAGISCRAEGVEARRSQCRNASWRQLRSVEVDNRGRGQLEIAARQRCRALQQGRYAEAASLFLDAVVRRKSSERRCASRGKSQRPGAGLPISAKLRCGRTAGASIAGDSRTGAWVLRHPAVIPSLVNLAGIARATGRYAEAEQIYRRILSVRWGTPDDSVGADQVLENFAEVLSLAHAGSRP